MHIELSDDTPSQLGQQMELRNVAGRGRRHKGTADVMQRPALHGVTCDCEIGDRLTWKKLPPAKSKVNVRRYMRVMEYLHINGFLRIRLKGEGTSFAEVCQGEQSVVKWLRSLAITLGSSRLGGCRNYHFHLLSSFSLYDIRCCTVMNDK